MKVLFIVNIPSPYRVDFFNELGKYCDLTVAFEREKANTNARDNKWKSDSFINFKGIFLNGIKYGEAEAFSLEIIRVLNKNKFDIVVVGMYSSLTSMLAIQYMKMKKINFILNSDGAKSKLDNKIKHKLKEYFISSAKYWLSPSKETDEYFNYYGAKKDNIYRYPFTSVFDKDVLENEISSNEKLELRNKLDIKEKYIVISVGRFIECKGYDLLIKACANLDTSIGVYIIGGKPTEDYIEEQKRLNINNIHYVSFLDKKKLSEYYKASDLFVLPTRGDAWGLVINEAISYGLPIITTDQCGAGVEIVKDDSLGKIIPTNDVLAISDSINSMVEDIEKIDRVKILKLSREYTIEKMVEAHMELFNKIGEI